MSKQYRKDQYLEDPEKKKNQNGQDEDVEEKLLYGDQETMEERERKKKEYQEKQLNE